MFRLDRLQSAFQNYRIRLNEGSQPQAGVWMKFTWTQGLTRGVLCAIFLCVVVWSGDVSFPWYYTAAFIAAFGTILPAFFLRNLLGHEPTKAPSSTSFGIWVIISTPVGLALGHFFTYALNAIYPIPHIPVQLTYLPELVMASTLFFAYWRFVSVRQWQFKLHSEKLKREAAEHGQALARAQLKMLQAQIEPHFLYNTLASVQHLIRNDPQLADFLLSQLITYLREAVPDIRGMGSTLGREFGLISAFLNIAKVRMGDRLEVETTIPEELSNVPFPSLLIQTLVENALKHGVEPQLGAVKISVTARECADGGNRFVEIAVQDNGVGFGAGKVSGTGIGLVNIRERLAGLYGDVARLTITGVSPTGVQAIIRIPV